MTDERSRARTLIESIIEAEAAAERARFRDIERDEPICFREFGLHPRFALTVGWSLFYLLGTNACGSCEDCVNAAWDKYLREEAERDD